MKLGVWTAVSVLLGLHSAALYAGDAPAPPDKFSGYADAMALGGSVRAGAWSSTRSLDNKDGVGASTVWLKAQPKLTEQTNIRLDGWVGGQHIGREGDSTGQLREAHLSFASEKTEVRIGRQVIAWGRSDLLNPTDNISARDHTLLFPEADDQRLGNMTVSGSYAIGNYTLLALWLPESRATVLPIDKSRGFVVHRRQPPWNTAQGAIKLDKNGGAWDGSISYFTGLDRQPDVQIQSLSATGGELILDHHRIHVLGIDAAKSIGRYALRAEAAYTFTEGSDSANELVKRSFLYLVAGGERAFDDNLTVGAQYVLRVISAYHDPREVTLSRRTAAVSAALLGNQLDRSQRGASLRVARTWFNDTLKAELSALAWAERLDFWLQPKIIYALTDAWKMTFGAEIYGGPAASNLGQLAKNQGVYFEVAYHF